MNHQPTKHYITTNSTKSWKTCSRFRYEISGQHSQSVTFMAAAACVCSRSTSDSLCWAEFSCSDVCFDRSAARCVSMEWAQSSSARVKIRKWGVFGKTRKWIWVACVCVGVCVGVAAGNAFCQAARLHMQLQNKLDSATSFVDAGNAYKKADPQGEHCCLTHTVDSMQYNSANFLLQTEIKPYASPMLW